MVCQQIMKKNFPENPEFFRLGIPKITIQFDQEEEKILCELPLYKQKIKDVGSRQFCLWLPSPKSLLFFHLRLYINI